MPLVLDLRLQLSPGSVLGASVDAALGRQLQSAESDEAAEPARGELGVVSSGTGGMRDVAVAAVEAAEPTVFAVLPAELEAEEVLLDAEESCVVEVPLSTVKPFAAPGAEDLGLSVWILFLSFSAQLHPGGLGATAFGATAPAAADDEALDGEADP